MAGALLLAGALTEASKRLEVCSDGPSYRLSSVWPPCGPGVYAITWGVRFSNSSSRFPLLFLLLALERQWSPQHARSLRRQAQPVRGHNRR